MPKALALSPARAPISRWALVQSLGIRLAHLEQVEASAKELLYPLTVTEPDGTPRIVPSYEALTSAWTCARGALAFDMVLYCTAFTSI